MRTKAAIAAYERGYRVDLDGCLISFTGRIMKPSPVDCGVQYLAFTLNYVGNECHRKTVYVHKLVAYQKYGVHSLSCEVRHLDGNSLNNAHYNIAIGTRTDNSHDIDPNIRRRVAINAGRISAQQTRKLTYEQVDELMCLIMQGRTYKELSKHFGIGISTISRIANGKTYV